MSTCFICHEDGLPLADGPTTCACRWKICADCAGDWFEAKGLVCILCQESLRVAPSVPSAQTLRIFAASPRVYTHAFMAAYMIFFVYCAARTAALLVGPALAMAAALYCFVVTMELFLHVGGRRMAEASVYAVGLCSVLTFITNSPAYIVYGCGACAYLAAGAFGAARVAAAACALCHTNIQLEFALDGAPPAPRTYTL